MPVLSFVLYLRFSFRGSFFNSITKPPGWKMSRLFALPPALALHYKFVELVLQFLLLLLQPRFGILF